MLLYAKSKVSTCPFDLCSSSSSAGVDHVVTAWCVDKQLRLAVMNGHRARVTGVTYIPQHGQFATCSFDKTVRLWDADNFTPVAEVGTDKAAARGGGRRVRLKKGINSCFGLRAPCWEFLRRARSVQPCIRMRSPTVTLAPSTCVLHTMQMKRRSPVKFVESRGDLVLCITLEVEAHVSRIFPGPSTTSVHQPDRSVWRQIAGFIMRATIVSWVLCLLVHKTHACRLDGTYNLHLDQGRLYVEIAARYLVMLGKNCDHPVCCAHPHCFCLREKNA